MRIRIGFEMAHAINTISNYCVVSKCDECKFYVQGECVFQKLAKSKKPIDWDVIEETHYFLECNEEESEDQE